MKKENNLPYFTICIPSYNRAYIITRCLDSLKNQTFKDFEVIIVDDGSTDNTCEKVDSYKNSLSLTYIKKDNGGKHTALNVGIENARDTELFMILDSDDWLCEDALETFQNLWEGISINDRKMYCGVMARCSNQDGRFVGDEFPVEPYFIDYVKFHFGNKAYSDCNECIRTDIIKEYRYPEPRGTKFVPEYYIFDQIGTKYKLLCVNQVTKRIEYLDDGITKNYKEFFIKNCVGYTFGIVCRIEKVFTNYKGKIRISKKIMVWYEYWYACFWDRSQLGARVSHVTFCGYVGKLRFFIKQLLVKMKIKEL